MSDLVLLGVLSPLLLLLGLAVAGLIWSPHHASRPMPYASAPQYDEAVLLGPVSVWVAEGEARAVRDWETKQPKPAPSRIEVYGPSPRPVPKAEFSQPEPDCDRCEWVEVTRLGDSRHHYLRGMACGVCPATRDPDLSWPMREAEWR